MRYTFQASASVSSVSPAVVLAEGSTSLTVLGRGFSSHSASLGYLLCCVGSIVVRAQWRSDEALVCNSTRGVAGEVRVEVSNN